MKRIFDITFTLPGIIVLLPVYVIISILILLIDGTPVLFYNKRPGINKKPFNIFKFRTMANLKDISGNLLPDNERLTRLGSILRSTSLDEFPALLNVLKGEMSLVGPRPLLMEYLPLYSEEQNRRHEVKPGITGWAQINGRNTITWEEKFRLDVWYVDNWSLWLDIKILGITFIKVFKRSGISQEGQATMEAFKGSSSGVID
ncbi:MAG: sugar transferase [Chlorobiaceae bacterium]|nr:sugar transferase [Chlorobiaceae bacterium]